MTSPQTEEQVPMHLRVPRSRRVAVEQLAAALDRSINYTTNYLIERGLRAEREERTGRPAGGAS